MCGLQFNQRGNGVVRYCHADIALTVLQVIHDLAQGDRAGRSRRIAQNVDDSVADDLRTAAGSAGCNDFAVHVTQFCKAGILQREDVQVAVVHRE